MRENPNHITQIDLPLLDIPTLVHRCLKIEEDRILSDNSIKELRWYLNEFSAYCQSQDIHSTEELTPSFLKDQNWGQANNVCLWTKIGDKQIMFAY